MKISDTLFKLALICGATANFISAQETAEATQCTAEVARSLVIRQVDDSKTVTDGDKQIKILLRTADFLWTTDEATARKHFADALALARERFKEKGVEEKAHSGSSGKFITSRSDFRFNILTAIAKRDATWAAKLTEEILAEFKREADKEDKFAKGEEERLLGLATSLLEINRPAALNFARRAIDFKPGNFKGHWHFFFYAAAKIDQTAADNFYLEVLNRKKQADMEDFLYFSGYPFGNSRIYGLRSQAVQTTVPPDFQPNANLQRQFLTALLAKAQSLPPAPEDEKTDTWNLPEAAHALSALEDLEPLAAERFPDLLPAFAGAKARVAAQLSAASAEKLAARREQNKKYAASFNEKFDNLEKLKPEELDYAVTDLVFQAKSDAELVRLADWLGKIGELKVRDAVTSLFYFKRAEFAVEGNRLPDAEKFAERVPELEFRAILAFKIAEARLKTENDKLRAADILETTVAAALKAPNGVERAQVLLAAAFHLEQYNQFRAAGALAEAVKTINRLENADISAASVYRAIEGKKFRYYASYGTPGYDLEESFARVARADFNGALIEAQNLSDKYLRTLAVIAVVGDCAEQTKSKKPNPKAR